MLLGTSNVAEIFMYPSSDVCLDTILSFRSMENQSTDSQAHDLVFILTYTINCETLYRQLCAFPNYDQSIQLGTSELL